MYYEHSTLAFEPDAIRCPLQSREAQHYSRLIVCEIWIIHVSADQHHRPHILQSPLNRKVEIMLTRQVIEPTDIKSPHVVFDPMSEALPLWAALHPSKILRISVGPLISGVIVDSAES